MKRDSAQSKHAGKTPSNKTEFPRSSITTSGTALYFWPSTANSTSTGDLRETIPPSELSPTPRVTEGVIVEAVLNYLRFQRSRGLLAIDVEEVARALSLSVQDVKAVIPKLKSHGVKLEA